MEGETVEDPTRPSELMLAHWSRAAEVVPAERALANLRAAWLANLQRKPRAAHELQDGETVRSTDSPWWEYDPRLDLVRPAKTV